MNNYFFSFEKLKDKSVKLWDNILLEILSRKLNITILND